MVAWEQSLLDEVQRALPGVTALRRWFHRHPELGAQEFATQSRIEQELDALGIAHRRIAGTGVLAELCGTAAGGDASRCLVLRADIDALPVTEQSGAPYASETPGLMHACGHDAHTACLLGAARVLCALRDRFAGRVLLSWQPGEEIGYGGRLIAQSGAIDAAQRSFGLHIAPDVPVGSVVLMPGANNASVDWFRVRVQGLGAHVCTPERGVDALYIASQIVVAAQALVTRRVSPMDQVLIGIGKLTAGTAYNIVAEQAQLEGTVRAFDPALRAQTKERLEALAKGIAALYGGTAELDWQDNTAPLINDETASREAQSVAAALFGADRIITSRRPALSGDDFAEYILRVPGVYAYVGSASPDKPNTCLAQHHASFDIDEDCLRVGTALYSGYALAWLNNWLT